MGHASIQFDFEELDFPIAGNHWLPNCLSGTASILVDDGQWSVESVDVCVTGVVPGKFSRFRNERLGQYSIEMCDAVELAISRNKAHHASLLDDIDGLSYDGREFDKDLAYG
jgi:hypothetical protein